MTADAIQSGSFVVLGASGGIGAEVARKLTAAGHRVLLAARSSDRLDALADELQASRYVLDASDVEQVENCFSAAIDSYGQIDGVVNCVGSVLLKPAHLTSPVEWHDTIATNLTSSFATVRAAAKTMSQNGGSVVLMSSAAARVGLANHEAIAAAKAGVIGLARSAAASYAARGIRFNVVAPGLVMTELTRKIWENERGAAMSLAMHALGRFGEAAEVASLVVWLLDPANSWVTGEVFGIDGGLGQVKTTPRAGTVS